ncbi:hypothetical protein [Paenibacillus illinoisensis]|uniref:hypothetical protein n=1 Tax=Paenibacillus illinoisensis TaxID=59845 RepID=UPI00301656CE
MFVMSSRYGNGYACSCCRDEWDSYEWVDSIPSFEEVYGRAKAVDVEGNCEERFEKDGYLVYGFTSEVARNGITTYVVFGGDANKEPDSKTCVRCDDGSKPVIEWSDLLGLHEEYLMETGGA